MPRLTRVLILFLVALAGALPSLAASASPLPESTPPAAPIVLPIEVIGPDGYTASVSVPVRNPRLIEDADRIYLRLHRAAYRDASVNPGRGPKASLRLNGGPWLGLTNDVVECFSHEAGFGCLHGSYNTLRMTVDLDHFGQPGLRTGTNTLEFRFNGTDGITNGYRVLDFNVLTTAGRQLLGAGWFQQDDPMAWTPPRSSPADIAAGEQLWYEADLSEGPGQGAPQIRATCAACHARDGRDLQYFSYSNHAIQERAKFHGLSQQEAEQIASYIRSLDVPRPAEGRPWNPPYQPGPGLDSRPAVEWAAGVGIDGVLENDVEARSHLFPEGINVATVAPDETLNFRELPIAMQLPDWNDWLPDIHPVDVWGNHFLQTAPVNAGDGDERGDVLGYYDVLTYRLETEGAASLIARNDLERLVEKFSDAGVTYFLNNNFGRGIANVPSNIPLEQARVSIRNWTIVKLWEIHNSFDLDGVAPQVYGSDGEARSWLGTSRQVFDLSPHLSADFNNRFAYQDELGAMLESSMWYHLQAIVNSGNRNADPIKPVDWNYYPRGVDNYEEAEALTQPYRVAAAWVKLIQLFHNDSALQDEAYARQAHPARWWIMGAFQSLEAHERADLFGTILTAYMDAVESHPISEWNRPADPNTTGRWEPATYTPRVIQGTWSSLHHQGYYADLWYTMIPTLRIWGVEDAVLTRMIDWGAQMWPRGNWNALRGPGATIGSGDGLAATYFLNDDLTSPDFQRVDPRISFDWQHGTPGGNLDINRYSVRWQGYVSSLFSGPITFHVLSNDGARLWVDGQLIVNRWATGTTAVEEQGTILLTAGQPVPITLEYFENKGLSSVQLAWSSPWSVRAVVPQIQLYSEMPDPETVATAPDDAAATTAGLPTTLALEPGAPNPFTTHTTLGYALPTDGHVRLTAYDLLGRRVAELVDADQPAGRYTATLSADGLAAGAYIVRLEMEGMVQTQRVFVVR